MNQKVDLFLLDGCGRCKLYQTPQCKVHKWPEELITLRALILELGLEEEIKWGFPCYTLNGKNILMLAPFKDNCAISFFKGALLKENSILEKSGENSNTFRLIRFQGMEKINQEKETIQQIIQEAIEIEKSGKKIYARGGVNEKSAELAYKLGFHGIALYGHLWKSTSPFEKYIAFVRYCKEKNIPIE